MQEPQEAQVQSLGQENPLEEGVATHSSILAWRIPWTEEPGGLQSTGLQRVRHDWRDWAHTHAYTCPVFIHSSVDRRLGCFHVLVLETVLQWTRVHMSFRIMFFFRYMSGSGIVGSYSSCIFSFLRNLHSVLYKGKWILLRVSWDLDLVFSFCS